MLSHLDNLLRYLFINPARGITGEDQVRFQPPDEDWRTYVKSVLNDRNALNVYLVELRENRKLRSNERVRNYQNGVIVEEPAPARLDCHYLITAWSPAQVTQDVEPTVDEHALLYQAAAVLLHSVPLNPSRIYAGIQPPIPWPDRFWDMELPMVVLPVESFPKYAEFWGTMGQVHPWKPAIYLVITLPVALLTAVAGPPVTTRMAEYGASGGAAEVLAQIGGTLRDGGGQAVPGAWVRLETQDGAAIATTKTDELGHFTFAGIHPGYYQLRAGHEQAQPVPVAVPAPGGGYDLTLP